MNREIIEAFLLSKEELLILLQIAGCRSWYGFYIEEYPISEEDAIKIIYRMVEKGFLYSDGEVLHVNKDLSEAVKVFKSANEVLLLEDVDNDLPMYCCYISEKVLVCEWMSQRKDTVKFKVCEKNDLYRLIEDEGYFQQYRSFVGELHENPSGRLLSKIFNRYADNEYRIFYEEDGSEKIMNFDSEWIKEYLMNVLNKEGKKLDWSSL